MITRIMFVGLMAGVVAGLAVAVLQHFSTTPLILKAEAYENASGSDIKHETSRNAGDARLILVHKTAGPSDAGSAHAEWAPKDGWERFAYTSITAVGTAVGYALILLALMVFVSEKITLNTGLAWGAAAFVATGLGPAFGLAPELPGSAAAAVELRQVWWVCTALVTALGLACLLRADAILTRVAGVALIMLPHVVGAPHPHELSSQVPAELAGHFAAASLGVHAALWALVGGGIGVFWQLSERRA